MIRASKARILLIAARPGLMRDSLLTFMQASSQVEIAGVVSDPETLVTIVRQSSPHTVVLDAALSPETLLLVQQLHTEQPALNCVVLADSLRQKRAFLAAGADHVLLKGHLDARLRIAVVGVPDLIVEREIPESIKHERFKQA